jgi:hypothetical protein
VRPSTKAIIEKKMCAIFVQKQLPLIAGREKTSF